VDDAEVEEVEDDDDDDVDDEDDEAETERAIRSSEAKYCGGYCSAASPAITIVACDTASAALWYPSS
jgi:hypothetical protein